MFEGPLAGLAAGEFGLVPASRGFDAGEALLTRGIDKEHVVALAVEGGLEEERGVDHQAGGTDGHRFGFDRVALNGDERMDEGLEAAAFAGIGENPIGDRGARDASVGPDDAGAPPADELIADLGAVEGGLGLSIGVDDDVAQGGEDACDLAFARADAAGEAEGDEAGWGDGRWRARRWLVAW